MVFNKTQSICIPVVRRNTRANSITDIFKTMCIGNVSRVDLVDSADGRQRSAYVYLDWIETKENILLQERIRDPTQQARLMYDAPWYWILLVNKNPKPAEKKVDDATEFPPMKVNVANTPSQRLYDEKNTFASVLCGTTARSPPVVNISQNHSHPTTEDIVEMTRMVMECDDEYEANLRAREQPQTAASSAQTINQELLVIIEDLQSRLARCEQMIVNSTTRSENTNDAVSYLVSANYHTTNHINGVDARLADLEYDMCPNKMGAESDME